MNIINLYSSGALLARYDLTWPTYSSIPWKSVALRYERDIGFRIHQLLETQVSRSISRVYAGSVVEKPGITNGEH